jgi:flagellar motor switch protein FliN
MSDDNDANADAESRNDLPPTRAANPGGGEPGAVYDISVEIRAVLGTSSIPIHQILKLGRGAVVELDRAVGEAVDVFVNDRLVARGDVVVVEDRLGVTITEVIKSGYQ